MEDVIPAMVKEGGGWLAAAILLILYVYQLNRNNTLTDRLIDLSNGVSEKLHESVSTLEKIPDAVNTLAVKVETLPLLIRGPSQGIGGRE